jgi:predicted nucleic acid-binding protein
MVNMSYKVMAKILTGCQKLGLAIGAEKQTYRNREREWLFWYDENYVRYPTPAERAELEAQRARAESQRADIATAAQIATEQKNNALQRRLRELGIDPDLIE